MQQKSAILSKNQQLWNFTTAKWVVFSVMILTYILVYFHRMAPGAVSEYLMSAFNTTGTKLGTLSAIYFFVYAFMQLPSGVIADTLGTRTSVVCGNAVAGLGSIAFGMATSFEMACIGRFFVGLGVSVVFVSIMKSNSVWFEDRVFGMMSGLTLLIGNLGSVLAAGPLAAILHVFAWRSVFIGIGSLSLVLAVLGYLFVRNRPEDMGFESPNKIVVSAAQPHSTHWVKNLFGVVKVMRIWPGFWVQFGMVGGLYSFMGLWGIPFLRDVYGLSSSYAANHLTTMLLCFAFGSLFFGWFSDTIGSRKPLLIFCVGLYIVCMILLSFYSFSVGYQSLILFGMMGVAGSGFVLTFALAKEVIHPGLSGMAVSVVNMGCFIGTAIIQPLFGYIADLTWDGTLVEGVRLYSAADYHNGFLVMLGLGIVAVIGAFRVRETNCRNIYKEFE